MADQPEAIPDAQTHTIICVDALRLKPNKFKHLGAELETGLNLKAKDWQYFEDKIKAIVVPYVVRKDFTKTPPATLAAIKILKQDALQYIESVAQCTVHPEDWEVLFRSADVINNRYWLKPCITWASGTLAEAVQS